MVVITAVMIDRHKIRFGSILGLSGLWYLPRFHAPLSARRATSCNAQVDRSACDPGWRFDPDEIGHCTLHCMAFIKTSGTT
jgi:hypothetical protein